MSCSDPVVSAPYLDCIANQLAAPYVALGSLLCDAVYLSLLILHCTW